MKMSEFGSSTFAAMKTANGNVPVVLDDIDNKKVPISEFASLADMKAADGKLQGSIAPDYSTLTFPVAQNEYCTHECKLYYCSVSGGIATQETWTSAHWTETNVSSVIGNVETLLASL